MPGVECLGEGGVGLWGEEEEQRVAQGLGHCAGTSRTTAPMLDESVIIQLVEMGFPMDACRKAVYYTGNSGAEAAMNWVMSHMDDPGRQGWVAGPGRATTLPKTLQPLPIHRFCKPTHPAWLQWAWLHKCSCGPPTRGLRDHHCLHGLLPGPGP